MLCEFCVCDCDLCLVVFELLCLVLIYVCNEKCIDGVVVLFWVMRVMCSVLTLWWCLFTNTHCMF